MYIYLYISCIIYVYIYMDVYMNVYISADPLWGQASRCWSGLCSSKSIESDRI